MDHEAMHGPARLEAADAPAAAHRSVPAGPAGAMAHLVVHVRDAAPAEGAARDSALSRLFALHAGAPRRAEATPLRLTVADREGRPVFALDDRGPQLELMLAPGTYHLTAEIDGARRGFTMALREGAAVDLHLRPRRERP